MIEERLATKFKKVYYKPLPNGDEVYYILVEQRKKYVEKEIGKKSDGLSPKEAFEQYTEKTKYTQRNRTRSRNIFWRYCKHPNGGDDKAYYITYRDHENKSRELCVGKESEGKGIEDARKELGNITNKLYNKEIVPKTILGRKEIFTFYAAFEKYMEHTQDNKKSWKKDKELFDNHLKELHGRELTSLTQYDFNKIKTQKLKQYSESTVKYILGVARQIINYAINNDLVKNYTNPISKGRVSMKQPNNAKLAFLTVDQSRELLSELKENHSKLIYDLTVMLLTTGARFIEVASLTWKDIDFKNNLIHFAATKNGNSRHIEMDELVIEVLKSQPKNNNFLVFPSTNGKRMIQMPRQWQDVVDKLFENNKPTITSKDRTSLSQEQRLEKEKQQKYRITVHSLRHTYASWLATSGDFSLLEIQKKLGHKTIHMTERYAHLIPSKDQEKHKKIFAQLHNF